MLVHYNITIENYWYYDWQIMTVGVIKRDSVKIYYMVLGIVVALQFNQDKLCGDPALCEAETGTIVWIGDFVKSHETGDSLVALPELGQAFYEVVNIQSKIDN